MPASKKRPRTGNKSDMPAQQEGKVRPGGVKPSTGRAAHRRSGEGLDKHVDAVTRRAGRTEGRGSSGRR